MTRADHRGRLPGGGTDPVAGPAQRGPGLHPGPAAPRGAAAAGGGAGRRGAGRRWPDGRADGRRTWTRWTQIAAAVSMQACSADGSLDVAALGGATGRDRRRGCCGPGRRAGGAGPLTYDHLTPDGLASSAAGAPRQVRLPGGLDVVRVAPCGCTALVSAAGADHSQRGEPRYRQPSHDVDDRGERLLSAASQGAGPEWQVRACRTIGQLAPTSSGSTVTGERIGDSGHSGRAVTGTAPSDAVAGVPTRRQLAALTTHADQRGRRPDRGRPGTRAPSTATPASCPRC